MKLSPILWVREAFKDFGRDLAAIPWRKCGSWLPFVIWVGGLVAGISLMCSPIDNALLAQKSLCPSDGNLTLGAGSYSLWRASNFFEVNIGFGELSFTQAKVIDICWDVVMGRGGQVAIALVGYRVLSRYLTATMHLASISFSTYRHTFLGLEPSLLTLFDLLRDFKAHRGLRSKVAMCWTIASLMFILTYPTIVSSMTAYSVNTHAGFNDQNGKFLSFTNLMVVNFVIHDGERLGLANDYAVTEYISGPQDSPGACSAFGSEFDESSMDSLCRKFNFGQPYSDCVDFLCTAYCTSDTPLLTLQHQQDTNRYADSVIDVAKYGFFGLNKTSSYFWGNGTIGAEELPPPALNISATYLDPKLNLSSITSSNISAWTDPRTNRTPFLDEGATTCTSSDWPGQYTKSYIQTNGRCVPTGTYNWGFSFLMLFPFTVLVLAWTTGTWVMWLKAQLMLGEAEVEEVRGTYKAVLVLSDAIRQQAGEKELNVDSLSEQELNHVITRDMDWGRVPSFPNPTIEAYSFHKSSVRWLKRDGNKYWILFFLLTVAGLVSGLFFFIMAGTDLLIMCIGMLLTMTIPRNNRSRAVMISIFIVSVIILTSMFR